MTIRTKGAGHFLVTHAPAASLVGTTFLDIDDAGNLDLLGTATLGKALYTAVVDLVDAATIPTDASLGNHFRVMLEGNRTLGNPTNPVDGQRAVWEITQDGVGNRTLAFDTKFVFGTDIVGATVSTAAGLRDYLTAIYHATDDQWHVVAFVRGY